MATVILVRHGRTTANVAGVLAGRAAGVKLDDVGRQQAARAAERLAVVPLVGVVSDQSTHETGTEPRGAIRNRVRVESGPRDVSTRAPTQLPQRV